MNLDFSQAWTTADLLCALSGRVVLVSWLPRKPGDTGPPGRPDAKATFYPGPQGVWLLAGRKNQESRWECEAGLTRGRDREPKLP